MADETAVLVNISEMIDLAIGTPEVGVVDFNMLQTVLHCLAQQLRVLGKNVELRGSVAALTAGRENSQTIAISEFVVETGKGQTADKGQEHETMLVVERVKKGVSPSHTPAQTPMRSVSPAAKVRTSLHPQGVSSTEKLSLVTQSKFDLLENTVTDLKNRVYGSMPKNEEILEEVRSQTNVKGITEMWTSLNVSSRLEAAENGIAKLSSLIQDLIAADHPAADAALSQMSTGVKPGGGVAPGGVVSRVMAAGSRGTVAFGVPPGPPPASIIIPSETAPEVTAALSAIKSNLEQQKAELDALANTLYNTLQGLQSGAYGIPGPPGAPGIAGAPGMAGIAGAVVPGTPSATGAPGGQVAADGKVTAGAPSAPGVPEGPGSVGGPGVAAGLGGYGAPGAPVGYGPPGAPGGFGANGIAALGEKVMNIEQQLKQCCDTIDKRTGVLNDKLNSIQDQLDYYLKQGATQASSDLSAGKLSPELIKELQGLMELFHTVQDMQDQLRKVHDTAVELAAEKEDREQNLNTLLEQIELLKVIKLDREDMVEAMADKADLRMLARKVSHDQFEMACDDLSKGLEHALGKLNLQEALWQQALDDIQREIETKLDKVELSPVKEFFNSKLKQLQENLKQMASLRREAEAAGTKRKLMRDVNCISCDAQAVMAMEAVAALPSSKPLPATLSMKPYLSYELDAIRKSQASNLPQRNMRDWENIDKQMAATKQPHKVRSETNKHLCNRYCGGSHTVTTPAQRVARLGHFIKQWGPDVLPLSSGLAAGDDGRMYRVSPIERQTAVGPGGAVEGPVTPKSPNKKSEQRPSTKSLVISNECRCMEGEIPLKTNQ